MKPDLFKMKPHLLRTSLLAGLLAVGSGYSLQASAEPLNTFTFSQSSGFLVDSSLVGSGGNNIGWYQYSSVPAPPIGEYNTIAWGVPVTTAGGGLLGTDPIGPATNNPATDLSGLRVLGHDGSVITGAATTGGSLFGAWASISTIYHQNRTIDDSADTLLAAVIQSTLTFAHPPGGVIGSDTNPVAITFNETINSGPTASCPGGNVAGGPPCNDLFTFPLGSFAPISFLFGGHKYEMEFQFANFVDAATNFPACSGGTCTIFTAEGVTSSADVQTRIREIDVPEPATLALFGLGLLGLGFSQRRKLNG